MVLSEVHPSGHDWGHDWLVEYVTSSLDLDCAQKNVGLTVRCASSIVAVHGLHEDHTSAWVDTSSGAFWLRDLLPRYIASARVLTYGYTLHADTFLSNRSCERVLQHAQTLVAELEADRCETNASRRPLIFICHGLGGLVVKRALAYSASRVSKKVDHLYSIFVSTYGILFFGTPHDSSLSPETLFGFPGSDMPSVGGLNVACKDSETLQNINDQFAPLMKQFHIHFFWEERNTITSTWTGLVVPESSAAPTLDDTERSGIWATHSCMCKFTNRESPGFSVVRATLNRYTRDANDVITNRWVQAAKALDRLRRNEAAELLDAVDASQASPIIYGKRDQNPRNKYFCVPYNASNIFTGREDLIELVEHSILRCGAQSPMSMQRRFVLYGLGGSGKTQFCLKFVQDHRQSFWGIFWVDASTKENAEQGFIKIAHLGQAGKSYDDGKDWLTNLEMSWILIIDNADDPSIDVSRFFPAGDRGHILLTSRNPECRWHQTVGFQEMREMSPDDATTLFLRAAAKDTCNAKFREQAKPITQALGYLPLALDQAGAAIRQGICTLRNYLSVYNRQRKQIMGTKPIQGSEAYKYTVYTTWEVSFQMIRRFETPAAYDACELLRILPFLHFRHIPASMLRRAWEYSSRSYSWQPKQTVLNRLWTFLRSQGIGPKPSVLPRMLDQDGQRWDTTRFQNALLTLQQFSLIARDVEQDEDSAVVVDDSQSAESYETSNLTYSMHPLVHFWARDRMNQADQDSWFQLTRTILARSITTIQDQQELAYRRALLPHIDCLFSSELASPVASLDSDLNKLKELFKMAQVYSEFGRWNSARAVQEQVVRQRSALLGEDHPETLKAISSLADVYWNSGMTEKAADLRRQELNTKIRLSGLKDRETLKAMDELAKTYWLCGRFPDAESLGSQALAGLSEILSPGDPALVDCAIHLARAYKHLGKPWKGLEVLSPVVEECERQHGSKDLVTLNAQLDLGMIYHDLNQFERAESMLEHVLAVRTRILGKNHAYTLWAVNDLAKIHTSQGRALEAERELTAILDVIRQTLGEDHVGMTMTLSNIASAYSKQGRFEEEASVLNDLHQIFEHKIETGAMDRMHPDLLAYLYLKAENYLNQGRVEEARDTYRHLAPMCRSTLGTGHPRTVAVRARLNEFDQAEEEQEQVVLQRQGEN